MDKFIKQYGRNSLTNFDIYKHRQGMKHFSF